MPTMSRESPQLSRDGSLPLYEQLKRVLSGMIDTGVLKVGDQLPTTAELCSRFGVSRITVTKALDDLARQGAVTRIQGKGTFVTGQRIERRLTNLISFTREMERQGLRVGSRILGLEELSGDAQQNLAFHRSADASARYIRIHRLRFVGDTPVCLATSVFPEAIGHRLLQLPLDNASFHALLEGHLGLRLLREERWITPVVADNRVARLLGIRRGEPLFRLEGITYLEGDVPIEATDSLFRGDKFRFVADSYRFIGSGEHEVGRGQSNVDPTSLVPR